MKLLDYKIAWIDDQPEQAQGYKERIATLLARHGFGLVVDWISSKDDLDGYLAGLNGHSGHDMIMVDWKLGQMVDDASGGASVAHKIRVKHSFATIVFYSAAEPKILRAEIAKQLIDGVFCVNRTYFSDEAGPLIKASVARFSDFNAMRGLFLSAVAEFDDLIRGAIFRVFQDIPDEHKQRALNQLLDGRIAHATSQVSIAAEHARPSNLAAVIKAIQPSSWELYQCLLDMLKLASPSPQYTVAVNKFSEYGNEVLTPRNDMAHLREQEKNGQIVLVRGDREWTAGKFDDLRRALSEHYENIQYIRKKLVDDLVVALKSD